jgi:hypothetical protein
MKEHSMEKTILLLCLLLTFIIACADNMAGKYSPESPGVFTTTGETYYLYSRPSDRSRKILEVRPSTTVIFEGTESVGPTGPGKFNRIRKLITVLVFDKKYYKVRTRRGIEGWIPSEAVALDSEK